MNTPMTSARWWALCLALAFLVVGVGCGGGGGGGYVPNGTLELSNDAFSTQIVDSIDVDELGGPDHYSYGVSLFPGDIVDIDLYPSTYDVTIYWSNGAIEVHTIDVFDGFTTFLNVSY